MEGEKAWQPTKRLEKVKHYIYGALMNKIKEQTKSHPNSAVASWMAGAEFDEELLSKSYLIMLSAARNAFQKYYCLGCPGSYQYSCQDFNFVSGIASIALVETVGDSATASKDGVADWQGFVNFVAQRAAWKINDEYRRYCQKHKGYDFLPLEVHEQGDDASANIVSWLDKLSKKKSIEADNLGELPSIKIIAAWRQNNGPADSAALAAHFKALCEAICHLADQVEPVRQIDFDMDFVIAAVLGKDKHKRHIVNSVRHAIIGLCCKTPNTYNQHDRRLRNKLEETVEGVTAHA